MVKLLLLNKLISKANLVFLRNYHFMVLAENI